MRFIDITKREIARIKNAFGKKVDAVAVAGYRPNPTLAKTPTAKPETRHYTKWELQNRANRRGEHRPVEGALALGILSDISATEQALASIRASRERLDAMHSHVLDIAPRLRDLCWAIDAASAEPEIEDADPVAA
jgi:hypothetical protein